MNTATPNTQPLSACSNHDAILAGFTREMIAVYDFGELHISIEPDTDLDDRFKAFDHDEQVMIMVNGWLFEFEPAGGYE